MLNHNNAVLSGKMVQQNLSGSTAMKSPISVGLLYADFVLNGNGSFMPFEKFVFIHIHDFRQWPVRYFG